MSEKNCLNCKHEPIWGDLFGGKDFPRVSGACQKMVNLPDLPETWIVNIKHVIKHNDGSGVKNQCKTWEPK